MQIVGIDCAAQDKNFGLAYASGRTVEAVAARVSDSAEWVVEQVDWERAVLLALDAPLGWPGDMGPVLQAHEPGARIDVLPNRLFRRHTDRVVATLVGRQPLDIGADRIARTARGALRVLHGIRVRAGRELPLLWDSTTGESGVIEVYPAGTLKANGLPYQRYKRNRADHAGVREEIVARMSDLLSLPDDPLLLSNADALDAVVCVLAALDFLDGASIEPGAEPEIKDTEGWIWVRDPKGSADPL